MTLSPEQALLAKARKGDQQAMGELLLTYQDRLYNVCLRMVSHPDDAAEVCQDVLMKVIQGIGKFRGESGLATWMTRIAMNQSISHLRRRKLRRTVSLDQPTRSDNGPDDQASALRHQIQDSREPGPDQCVQDSEMLARLKQAISHLDDDFRAVLVLRDIEQLDYAQIGKTLEVPVGTVKSRLFRARLALRKEMDRLCSVGGVSAEGSVSASAKNTGENPGPGSKPASAGGMR